MWYECYPFAGIWMSRSLEYKDSLNGHKGQVWKLSWNPKPCNRAEHMLASAGDDTLIVWSCTKSRWTSKVMDDVRELFFQIFWHSIRVLRLASRWARACCGRLESCNIMAIWWSQRWVLGHDRNSCKWLFFNKVINKIRQFIKKVRNCLEFGVQEFDREVWISIYQYILVCVATQLHYFTWNRVALFWRKSLEREISLQRNRTWEIVNEALLFDHVLVQVLH